MTFVMGPLSCWQNTELRTSNNRRRQSNEKAPPLPITYLPAHPFHHGHPGLRDEEKVSGVFTSRTEATIRNELGREYACIENIDTQIGRIVQQLDRMGELNDTYILFTSDHGIAVGRHGLTGKQNLYEHTWRVPLIVMGPGIKSDTRAPGTFTCSIFSRPFATLPKSPSLRRLRGRASSRFWMASRKRFVMSCTESIAAARSLACDLFARVHGN